MEQVISNPQVMVMMAGALVAQQSASAKKWLTNQTGIEMKQNLEQDS